MQNIKESIKVHRNKWLYIFIIEMKTSFYSINNITSLKESRRRGPSCCISTMMRKVCGGEVGGKEKQTALCTMKRGRTGEVMVMRNSLMCEACTATYGHGDV